MTTTFKHAALWTWPGAVTGEDPQRMVRRLQEARIDIIIPYTCAQRGGEVDPALYEERLRGIIEEAHRAGLMVHGCFDEINCYEDMPVYGLRQVRADGSMGRILCPANPSVVDYILGRLRRMLETFDYDGVNLEDGYVYNSNTIYDPAHQTGETFRVIPVCYCGYCQKNAPIDKPEWAHWKRERMTALIGSEAELIRRLKPGLPFSVAARMPYDRAFYTPHQKDVPYFEGWQVCQSRDALGADWVEWLRRGHIDFACPMSYFNTARLVELETLECRQLIPQANQLIWIGLGLGDCTAEYLQGTSDVPGAKDAKNPAHRNDARALEVLLRDQLRMGQENVVFFAYEHLLDEHLPVIARFR